MELQPHSHAHPPAPSKTSKLAIWSLVTGILSLCCSFLTGIPAVIMGIVSLNKIKKSNGTLSGGSMAIAGIVTGIVCGLIGLAVLSGPLILRQLQKADTIALTANLQEFHVRAMEYSLNHHGAFPDKTTAEEWLAGYKVHKPSSGDWCYFPESVEGPPFEVLLISPSIPDTLVLRVDGSVVISKDKEDIRKLIDSSRTPATIIPATRH